MNKLRIDLQVRKYKWGSRATHCEKQLSTEPGKHWNGILKARREEEDLRIPGEGRCLKRPKK
jgi:hypothetical protein